VEVNSNLFYIEIIENVLSFLKFYIKDFCLVIWGFDYRFKNLFKKILGELYFLHKCILLLLNFIPLY